ncbi:hypothetical protein N8653_00095 [Euryarchaeota archaeon]|nr:hypothetical protein [Euryarchaeota archaeon]
MARRGGRHIIPIIILGLLLPTQISMADEVISAEPKELLIAGDFTDPSDWEITSTSGFSDSLAEYSVGMVADNELSITHNRPDNFAYHTSWATTSSTNSNNTIGEPDGSYTWSTGPEISMDGYDFNIFNNFIIKNVSLILHISIPSDLNQDEVNILLKNHGSDKLIETYTNVDTSGGLNRMNNPIIINIDGEVEWTWDKLEITEFTIDYVSDNIGLDDSEIRVDAVGLRIKYHQPWYSFETVKAETEIVDNQLPVLDFGPYDGNITGLSQSTCGLKNPESSSGGIWSIEGILPPPSQSIGRIYSYGEGNFTITYELDEGNFQEISSGELFPNEISYLNLRIVVNDGCIEKIRLDINDPKLIVEGYISGNILGLSNSSSILFAIGEDLVHSIPISLGNFSFYTSIGQSLPENGIFSVGVATRLQWSSNGTQETTIIHITSMSIDGGYDIDWDYDPECIQLDDLEIDEDEGGLIIPVTSRCEDDITSINELYLSGISMDGDLVSVSSSGGDLRVQPNEDAFGNSLIFVTVIDERGNYWNDNFNIKINSVPDQPIINDLPLTTYVDLGDTKTINISIIDVDTDDLTISTSRSWATIDLNRNLVLSPVQSGVHIIEIIISDGLFEITQSIEVIVEAKPDLLIEYIEVTESGVVSNVFEIGDIIEIISYVRNTGMGDSGDITIQCTVGDILIGYSTISNIAPGGLGIAVCDFQIESEYEYIMIKIEVDSILEIQELNEDNNINTIEVKVIKQNIENINSNNRSQIIFILASLGLIIISIAALQLGPSKIKREYDKFK